MLAAVIRRCLLHLDADGTVGGPTDVREQTESGREICTDGGAAAASAAALQHAPCVTSNWGGGVL